MTKKDYSLNSNQVKNITLTDAQSKLSEILQITKTLAESHQQGPKPKSYFRLLEYTYRRATYTLLTLYSISQEITLADSCFVFLRKMVEDVIFIEYIIYRGKEELTEQFIDYAYVQAHEELKLMKELSLLSDEQKESYQSIEHRYQDVRDKFKKPDGRKFHSPFGIGFIGMLREINLHQRDKARLKLAYLRGSIKVHLNPVDLISYKTDEYRVQDNKIIITQSIITSIWVFSKMTFRYIDEIREVSNKESLHEDILIKVDKIFDDFVS